MVGELVTSLARTVAPKLESFQFAENANLSFGVPRSKLNTLLRSNRIGAGFKDVSFGIDGIRVTLVLLKFAVAVRSKRPALSVRIT